MTIQSGRKLCPLCRGMNDSCTNCDGGWIREEEPTKKVTSVGVPMIVDSKKPSGHPKDEQVFRKTSKRIILGPRVPTGSSDVQILTKAARAIAEIEKTKTKSSKAYYKAADVAFVTIKELSKQNISDQAKTRLKHLLNTAYYHFKTAKALIPPLENAQEKNKRSRATTLTPTKKTVVPRQETKTMTLMQLRLAEVGITNNINGNADSESESADVQGQSKGGAVVRKVGPSDKRPLDFRTKEEHRNIAEQKAAANAEKRAAKAAREEGIKLKKRKKKKGSVWTIPGGAIETNRSKH